MPNKEGLEIDGLKNKGQIVSQLIRVRTDSSSDTDRGPIWVNLG